MTKHESHDGKHFKMLSTQPGVRHGEVHPVVFHEGKTYAIDESLKKQFHELKVIEPSHAEPEEPTKHSETPEMLDTWKDPLNENVLDEDPAVLRHAELPVDAIHAQNDAAQQAGDMTPEAEASLGRAEPTLAAEGEKPAKAEHKPHGKPKR